MGIPEEDLPQFPVYAAESLAGELERLATKLEEMISARALAGNNLPEFQCTVAEQFRSDLSAHGGNVADVVARFRRTAGSLRDAVAEHREARRQMLALTSGHTA